MALSPELDQYVLESIQHSIGLPVSNRTLLAKLMASQQAREQLQAQVFSLHDRLKEKDEKIDRYRAEASLNAQALRKYIGENEGLLAECADLSSQRSRLEKECSLYDRDREALMEFGNEADQRAKEAELRALEAEQCSLRLMEEIRYYKQECEVYLANKTRMAVELHAFRQRVEELECTRSQSGMRGSDNDLSCSECSLLMEENQELRSLLQVTPVESSGVDAKLEAQLLDALIASVLSKVEAGQVKGEPAANACSLLETHQGVEVCRRLFQLWERLKPETKNVIGLAAQVESLQKAKEHLRTNLHRAEEEVKALFDENNILDEENKRLLRQWNRDRHHGCDGSHSAKNKKKTSSPKVHDSVNMAIDFNGPDSPRHPLSPLHHNSSPLSSKLHKLAK